MTLFIVVFMLLSFIVVDIVVRAVARRFDETRARRERAAVLETSVRLEVKDEATSLKRVEVPGPKARILAVDDEPVVLDSFRRILVLEGFNVDTVENGPEALGLVQRRDYDFVFTDLKMPEMDGVEVVKAVKHLRPDIDVVVITGYASIETAVETLKHGACEYVQKPFTATELAEVARRLLIKREARIEAARRPAVRVVTPSEAEFIGEAEYCVPGGAFISPGHVWVRLEPNGDVRVGIDDFTRKVLGEVDKIEAPLPGRKIEVGQGLFTVKRGNQAARIQAPVAGTVETVNEQAVAHPELLTESPYDSGWVCIIHPSNLAGELPFLRIGANVVEWYQDEAMRWRKLQDEPGGKEWATIERQFLEGRVLTRA